MSRSDAASASDECLSDGNAEAGLTLVGIVGLSPGADIDSQVDYWDDWCLADSYHDAIDLQTCVYPDPDQDGEPVFELVQ